MITSSVPHDDLSLWHSLPQSVRDEVDRQLPVIAQLVMNGKKGIGRAIKNAAQTLGLDEKTVRTKYDLARKKKTWRVLINKRRLSSTYSSVPSVFIPFWHGLVFENQRSTAKAHEKLCRMWLAGDHIEGYPPAGQRPAKMPEGLSLRNLGYRKPYKPTKAQLAMARQGIAESRKFLPNVPQDVSEVRALEYILFDDVELDFLIIIKGYDRPVKLRLIVAMDLCSRVILGYAVRPAIPRADGVEDGLKLRDMKAVVARFLRTFGVPVDYPMHFIVENATAAIPDAMKTALAEISGGFIIVHDTDMVVGQILGFFDKASGNSRGKAWLEASFNPLHGELADQPGQKGRRYDLAPAELEGRRKELATLVRTGQRLPLDLRYQFQYPFKRGDEAIQELDAALARLHTSTHRTLQGFDDVALWQINAGDKPKPESELPDYLIGQANLIWTTRVESPMERLQRKVVGVERREISDSSLQRLMDEYTEVRFQNYQFAFTYQRTDYVYLPAEQLMPLLQEGVKYLLWFHPQDMETVYITRDRPHLGYVGKLGRHTRVRRGDLEDAKEHLKETQRMFNKAKAGVQDAGLKKIHSRADDLEYNANLINEATANAKAMEMEVDVVTPDAQLANANAPHSIQVMTADIAQRTATTASEKRRAKRVKNLSEIAEAALSELGGGSQP